MFRSKIKKLYFEEEKLTWNYHFANFLLSSNCEVSDLSFSKSKV